MDAEQVVAATGMADVKELDDLGHHDGDKSEPYRINHL
jgi:hypothetical protein